MKYKFVALLFVVLLSVSFTYAYPKDWCVALDPDGDGIPTVSCFVNSTMAWNNSNAIQALGFYNRTQVDAFLSLKLNTSDQRYNDTAYINANFYTKTVSDSIYYNSSNPRGFINDSFANNSYGRLASSNVWSGSSNVFEHNVTIANINTINTSIELYNTTGVKTIDLNSQGSSFMLNALGIGTSSPSYALSVNNSNFINSQFTRGSVNGYIALSGTDGMLIGSSTSSGNMITILSNGNVGIGTASPSAKLHVNSTSMLLSSAVTGSDTVLTLSSDPTNTPEDDTSRILMTQDGGGTVVAIGGIGSVQSEFNGALHNYGAFWNNVQGLQFATSNTSAMVIDNTQDVGIGTSDPVARLHINSTGTSNAYNRDIQLSGSLSAIGASRGIAFTNANVGNIMAYIGMTTDPSGNQGELFFATATATTTNATERVRIDNGGNVGVNTKVPATIVDVNSSANSAQAIRIYNLDTGVSARAGVSTTSNAGSLSIFSASQAYTAVPAWSNSSALVFSGKDLWIHGVDSDNPNIIFALNTSSTVGEVARFTSNKNLGIGNTNPSARLTVTSTASSIVARFEADALGGNSTLRLRSTTTSGNNVHGDLIVVANSTSADVGYIGLRVPYTATIPPFIVNTDGKVGIGNIAPPDKLTVSASNSQFRIIDIDDGNFTQLSYSTDQLAFRMNSGSAQPALIINDNNKVFINSSNGVDYGTTLHVSGNANITSTLSVGGGSAGKAMCWKADGKTLGYCLTVVDATGGCTCN